MDLRQWRRDHRLSQAQLARLLEIDQMTISRWERGGGKRGAPGRMLELALKGLELELQEQQTE